MIQIVILKIYRRKQINKNKCCYIVTINVVVVVVIVVVVIVVFVDVVVVVVPDCLVYAHIKF